MSCAYRPGGLGVTRKAAVAHWPGSRGYPALPSWPARDSVIAAAGPGPASGPSDPGTFHRTELARARQSSSQAVR